MSEQKPLARRTKTTAEVAEILGITHETVRTLIRSGRLTAIDIGRKYLISDAEIARFLGETESAA